MSVVKIILILGLIYVAMNEKVEKTRNMLLVVTGLLAFCMFSVEGLQVLDPATCTETATTSGGSSVQLGNKSLISLFRTSRGVAVVSCN